jgi:hypothetical protein
VTPELRGLDLADAPERWEALGFTVSPGEKDADRNHSGQRPSRGVDLGGVRLRLGAAGRGITGWTLTGIPTETREIDGLRTAVAEPSPAASAEHPNGAIAVDHVVVTSPDFDRSVQALEAVGMPLRRVVERSDGVRMGFRRLGGAILELVEAGEASGPGPASAGSSRPAGFWGLVVVVDDLDTVAHRLGDGLGSIRRAVQPGRRIATLRESAGLGEAVAFMSPERRP